MKKNFRKWVLLLNLAFIFLWIIQTEFTKNFVRLWFFHYIRLIFILISLLIVSKEWNSNEKTLPIIQIIIAILPLYYTIHILVFPQDPLSGLAFFQIPYELTLTSIFMTSGIRALLYNWRRKKDKLI